MENNLPKDWRWVKLGEVGKIETGTTPGKSNAEYYGNEVPFFKPTDLQQGINTITASDNLSKLGFEKTRKLPKNSILVTCIGATIGKTGLIKVEGASNQQINSIIPDKLHNPKFVFYQIISHTFQNQIKDNASSTTLPILNKSKFQQLNFLTTTFDSQQVIVSKIEELFSELDKGIENLRIVQQKLKTYRQSVLKSAFEGKLSAQSPNHNSYNLHEKHDLNIAAETDIDYKRKINQRNHLNNDSDKDELPPGWKWTKIRDITEMNPKIPNREKIDKQMDVQFLPMKLVEEVINNIHLTEIRKYEDVLKGSYTPFINGDVIFAKIEHTHCYAVWTAARAVQRSFTTTFALPEYY